ncbi:MAG TPA: spherulation-specific family 4 protein [Polyangia bacterium]
MRTRPDLDVGRADAYVFWDREALARMGEIGRVGSMAALLCSALAACSVNGGEGSHSGSGGDGGTASAPGSGGSGPPLALDAGTVAAGSLHMIVPAYWTPDSQWQRIIADAPTVGMIIFNPASGAGTATDPAYPPVITQAQKVGIRVLGYVSTQYGQRAEADIDADVNAYYSLYSPSGIYFAEGPMENDCDTLQPLYERLTTLARSHDPMAYVAIGTHFCPTFITFSDLMVEFAETYSMYQAYTSPSWMPGGSPERFCHFVSEVPAAAASSVLSRAIRLGAGWVFATDGAAPNPWGALPSYYDQQVAAIKALP